jgi:hypothetical protein
MKARNDQRPQLHSLRQRSKRTASARHAGSAAVVRWNVTP